MTRQRLLALLAGATMLLAACGGGSPTTAPAQTTGSATTSGETTAGETTSGETTAAETTAGETTAGGPGSADACGLLTPEEVTAVTGFGNIEAQPVPDSETDALSGCGFVSDGVLPAAIVTILDPENTNTDISGYLALPMSEEVAVNGAKAAFVPAAGNVLFVIKGDRVATVLITPQQGEAIDAAKAVVQRVADRL